MRTKQNSETQKHASTNIEKNHKLAAIFGKFQIKLKCKLDILRQ
jgi:hypothetical protein